MQLLLLEFFKFCLELC